MAGGLPLLPLVNVGVGVGIITVNCGRSNEEAVDEIDQCAGD